MKLLVIGGGGREHALAWKLAQSTKVNKVYVAPGNGGTAQAHKMENLAITDYSKLADFCLENAIDFTVVGPDAALADAVVDLFQAKGLKIFGPTKAAAKLEWSKDFAKAFMQRHNIPTAKYMTFSDAAQAHAYIDEQGAPIVIKADGLAAGKGVIVANSLEQAHAAITDILENNRFAAAGAKVVIEEFMQGEEASFFVLSDGENFITLPTAQDHKRLLDGDLGPNTGGMGSYSPAPIITPDLRAKVLSRVVRPTIAGMRQEGTPFVGFLYVGLMIEDGEARVVEFNARMGDPETQVLMLRLKSDLVPLLQAAVQGKLNLDDDLEWDRRHAMTVILAASGYPDNPRKGDEIFLSSVNENEDEFMLFHAGTERRGESLFTNGGRVLCVTTLGESLRIAQQKVYEKIAKINFAGMQYRKDIGWRSIK